MKSTFNVLDLFYAALNVVGVTSKIDGRIYRFSKPTSVEHNAFIKLVPLYIDGDEHLQKGLMNINVFVKNLDENMPNEATLKAVVEAVKTALVGYASTSTYFNIDIASENTLADDENPMLSYSNIRVNYSIES